MSHPNYLLYTKHEYLATLTDWIKHATPASRVLVMSMSFEPDKPEIAALLDAIEFAAQKGAEVHFGIDARSFMERDAQQDPRLFGIGLPGPLWFDTALPASSKLQPPYELKQQRLERLRKYPNVHVTVTNSPARQYSLTIAGRSHIKIGLVDDRYMIGGCNLDDPNYIDLMTASADKKTADKLYELLSDALQVGTIRDALRGKDIVVPVDDEHHIIIDAGVPNQSEIFESALDLIDKSREWLTITCQFFPNSITAQHLLRARRRGVKVEILYASLWGHGPVGGSIQLVSQAIERLRLPSAMFKDGLPRESPKIHAKVIACDAGVMIGSHNYVNAGVRLGTAEIALHSTDSELAERTVAAIRTQIRI